MDQDVSPENRLIIVSNRLPVVLTRGENGSWDVRPGSGGLVTALAPVLRNRGGIWIGWPGTVQAEDLHLEELLAEATRDSGYSLRAVALTEEEQAKYYQGFSNEIIWPLFHDLQSNCNYDPDYWFTYQKVNRRFADVIAENSAPHDFIWIHDYHLMAVAKELRVMGIRARCGFFLHIPFPSPDIFLKLPWRFQVLSDLLEFDLLGFQTLRDRRNFVQCIRALAKEVAVVSRGQMTTLHVEGRQVRVGAFPISIDYAEFADHSATQEVADTAWYIHEDLPQRKIILGVDRLDYTKGIPQKLDAFRTALRKFPDLHEKIVLVQVVVPSRFNIPKYLDLKTEIERKVGEINGEFTRSGWVPIHYIYRNLNRRELLAYYRTAEIALITPLKDGMNLVAKEYCASNLEHNGVLILSEFAGAVAQLQKGAMVVNPYDVEGVGRVIYQAVCMSAEERRFRMRRLRHSIRKRDVYWWVNSFLQAAISKRLDQFPLVEDYAPTREVDHWPGSVCQAVVHGPVADDDRPSSPHR
ncbi:MAG: trehalose-6-phosphate synthase [Candidatus Eisenbacteria sp.]|nr:trehalose-6-phosphate synthase [Candidatus Eisenbacteria bacterium]